MSRFSSPVNAPDTRNSPQLDNHKWMHSQIFIYIYTHTQMCVWVPAEHFKRPHSRFSFFFYLIGYNSVCCTSPPFLTWLSATACITCLHVLFCHQYKGLYEIRRKINTFKSFIVLQIVSPCLTRPLSLSLSPSSGAVLWDHLSGNGAGPLRGWVQHASAPRRRSICESCRCVSCSYLIMSQSIFTILTINCLHCLY